jgi:hypothetical protein
MASDDLLSDYLLPNELAAELKVQPRTLARWRVLGEAPPVTMIGRKPYFAKSSVAAWLKAREQKKPALKTA